MKFAKFASGEVDSLPQIQVPSTPAQDKNTLPGMVPPISFTRVNAGTPPNPDAGAMGQKSQPAMGAQMLPKTAQAFSREDRNMNMTSRPLIQDLVKGAMANAALRSKIASEGARQLKLAEEECDNCDKDSSESEEKKASVGIEISTEFALKLASAIEYAVPILAKQAEGPAAVLPPGVSMSAQRGELPGPGGYGKGMQQPPKNPGTQKASPKEHSLTQMANTMDSPPGGMGTQTTAMSGGQGKTAAVIKVLEKKNLAKLASLTKAAFSAASRWYPAGGKKKESSAQTLVDYFLLRTKVAEDAINPAQISAGAAVPPDTSASGESGGAPVAGMPQGPRGLVGSNESAINYKKQTAYSPRKSELAAYFNEPALSAAHDRTLNEAFAHTGEAGVKISSVQQTVKSAAARALLLKIAEEAEKKDEKKDDKKKQSVGPLC